jgi:hypothetical protein
MSESEDSRRGECKNCGYITDLATYPKMGGTDEVNWFCEVCAGTFLGRATEYPHQLADPLLYKSIGWIANRLLDEIRGHRA